MKVFSWDYLQIFIWNSNLLIRSVFVSLISSVEVVYEVWYYDFSMSYEDIIMLGVK